MSTPALLTGTTVSPARTIDPRTASVAKIGELLKALVSRTGTFHSESEVLAAHEAIDDFKRAFSTGDPDVRDDHRASVAKPVDPVSVVTSVAPGAAPAIDYNALARAIVAVQQGGSDS